MKRLALATSILALVAPLALAQSSTWKIDPAHSEVDFTVRHMSVSNVHGRIGNLNGTILLNEADTTKSSVQVTIDIATVDTGVAMRDADLKSANFFDTTQFSTATFTSTSVTKNGNSLTVTGNLSMHGVTKPVVLEVEGPSSPMPGMDHKPHSGFSASTTLKRTDFGIGSKFPPSIVGDEIKLTVDLEVVKQ
jgi:polyisoprenoid-binding protein YceI